MVVTEAYTVIKRALEAARPLNLATNVAAHRREEATVVWSALFFGNHLHGAAMRFNAADVIYKALRDRDAIGPDLLGTSRLDFVYRKLRDDGFLVGEH